MYLIHVQPSSKVLRWRRAIQEYDNYVIIFLADFIAADTLSMFMDSSEIAIALPTRSQARDSQDQSVVYDRVATNGQFQQ